jgi:hypothetical protein
VQALGRDRRGASRRANVLLVQVDHVGRSVAHLALARNLVQRAFGARGFFLFFSLSLFFQLPIVFGLVVFLTETFQVGVLRRCGADLSVVVISFSRFC